MEQGRSRHPDRVELLPLEQLLPVRVRPGAVRCELLRALEIDVAGGDDVVTELAEDEDVVGGDPPGADEPDPERNRHGATLFVPIYRPLRAAQRT